jgi:hypothetical protein
MALTGQLVSTGTIPKLTGAGRLTRQGPYEDYTGSLASGQQVVVASVPFWGDAPDAWNTVVMAGKPLPGIAKVHGAAFDIRVDRKSIPGTHGEHLTTLGREPCDPEIEVKLWMPIHLENFLAVVKLFLPKTSAALPPPVDVVHPALAMFKVRAVRVMKCSFPEEREPGIFYVTMRCREFIRGSKGTKPTTDTASIIKEGPGAVQKKVDSFKTPDVTNGNAPRTKQQPPPVQKPVSTTPRGL